MAVAAECCAFAAAFVGVVFASRHDALAGIALIPAIALCLVFGLCLALRPLMRDLLPDFIARFTFAAALWAVVLLTLAYAGLLVVVQLRS